MVGGRPTDNESLLIELGETGLHGTVYWVYSGFDRSPEIQKDGAAIYGECNCSVARSGPRDGGRWRNVPRLYSVYLSLHQSQQGGGRGEFRTIHAFHRLCRYGKLLQTIHHRPRRPFFLDFRCGNRMTSRVVSCVHVVNSPRKPSHFLADDLPFDEYPLWDTHGYAFW